MEVNAVKTEVWHRHPARHDMCGRFLGYPLSITDKVISAGLAKRLVQYGLRALDSDGFKDAVSGWEVTVGTNDADSPPSERWYWVSWTNPKGGSLVVEAILTRGGWPHLDGGLKIHRA